MRKTMIAILLTSLAASSCEDEYSADRQPSIVVEGWIEDGEFPVVILTKTLPVSKDYQDITDMSEYLIKWAKVTVSDGQDSVVLTGMYDKGYFPPYIYTTGKMRGQAGKRYTLTVDYRQWHATAATTIPYAPHVDAYRIEKCAGSDTLYSITAIFTDNREEKNYYQIFTKSQADGKQYAAAYLGSIDDDVLPPQAEIPIYRAHRMMTGKYTPYFSVNDTVSVKFTQTDKQSYMFWNEYIKSQSLSNNMFLSTSTNLPTNIVGGLGYWCGYGATTEHIIIKERAEATSTPLCFSTHQQPRQQWAHRKSR